eukprot:6466476-Karenia_brevis.AAC.1
MQSSEFTAPHRSPRSNAPTTFAMKLNMRRSCIVQFCPLNAIVENGLWGGFGSNPLVRPKALYNIKRVHRQSHDCALVYMPGASAGDHSPLLAPALPGKSSGGHLPAGLAD